MNKFYCENGCVFMDENDIMEEYIEGLRTGKTKSVSFKDYYCERLITLKAAPRVDAFDSDESEGWMMFSQIVDSIVDAIEQWMTAMKLDCKEWTDEMDLDTNNYVAKMFNHLRTLCEEEDAST